ncbi:MAG: hypothetical protein QWI73_07270 [Alphaproteobacteria bacterium]|nr:hypothetical protein [Alphaproteobacteria bacterium]
MAEWTTPLEDDDDDDDGGGFVAAAAAARFDELVEFELVRNMI